MKKIEENSSKNTEDAGVVADPAHDLPSKVETCPTGPGVYLMKGSRGQVLYVGKAKNLRSRVRSYFQDQASHSAKTVYLVSQIHDIEYLRAGSEVEALLLENNLIKKWKPKYNIRLKDDKTYPYVKIDMNHPFPRGYIARKQVKGDRNLYFGPFPNSGALRRTLHFASKLFQLRDCRDHEFSNRSRPCLSHQIGQCTAPCVGLVSPDDYRKQVDDFAAFVNGDNQVLAEQWEKEMNDAAESLDFEKAARLRDRLQAMREAVNQEQRTVDTKDMEDRDVWALWPSVEALTGTGDTILDVVVLQFRGGKWVGRIHRTADLGEQLETEDLMGSLLLQYYTKHVLPQQILLPPDAQLPQMKEDMGEFAQGLCTATKQSVVPEIFLASQKGEWARLWELASENARGLHEESQAMRNRFDDGLIGIARMLDLPESPKRIECVDISNFQGEANVASCVVFTYGKPDKAQYRHYKIQGVVGQNDFASMREVMSRRYGKPDSQRPDLLVVDGGRGQLSSATEILKGLGCDFPVVGLAKARTESDFASEEVKSSEERIFVPGQKNPLKIRNARALQILTHIRDEAHRFAIEFHRLKRSQARGL